MKKNITTSLRTHVWILAFCLLGACADQGLGFGKSPPNEFLILTYPPLTVPPSIALRAPSNPGDVAQTSPTALAARSVYGRGIKSTRGMSAGEKALAQKVGIDKALPNIRELIAADGGLGLYPREIIKKIIPKQAPKK